MAKLSVECQALYDSASDILFDHDFNGRVLRVNRAFEEALRTDRITVTGSVIYSRIAPEMRDSYRQRILERLGGALPLSFEIEMLGESGRVLLEVRLEIMFDNGSPVGIRCIGRDIMSQVRSRISHAAADVALLRQTEELATFSRYLQLLHRLSTTSYASLDDLCTDYLTTGCQIFTLECGAFAELRNDVWTVRRAAGQYSPEVLDELLRRVRDEEATVVGSAPGVTFFTGTPVLISDQLYGALVFWSEHSLQTHPQAQEMIEMMARGIESAVQQRQLTDELEYRARHDSLTGLANRSTLAERLERELEAARTNRTSVGVVFMDLDRFKQINDSLGHAAGDVALQEVARRFRAAAGGQMLVARVGGDEFAAIVPGMRDSSEAMHAAELLLRALEEPLHLNGHCRSVSASSGVALYPDDGENGSILLVKADAAMYEGKQAGGNTVRIAGTQASLAG